LFSKWIGEGEKRVKALFTLAEASAPSVIFMDEVDSVFTARSETDHESSRRMKNQFLSGLDGCLTSDKLVLLVGATNLPEQLDTAALRRFPKKLLIPLPGPQARRTLFTEMLGKHRAQGGSDVCLGPPDLEQLVQWTEGFAGSDIKLLCEEAVMVGIRDYLEAAKGGQQGLAPRPMGLRDFEAAMQSVKPASREEDLARYRAWNADHGSYPNDQVFADA